MALLPAQETDCVGGMTHVEWCNPCKDDGEKLHPRSFTTDEVPCQAALTGIKCLKGRLALSFLGLLLFITCWRLHVCT